MTRLSTNKFHSAVLGGMFMMIGIAFIIAGVVVQIQNKKDEKNHKKKSKTPYILIFVGIWIVAITTTIILLNIMHRPQTLLTPLIPTLYGPSAA